MLTFFLDHAVLFREKVMGFVVPVGSLKIWVTIFLIVEYTLIWMRIINLLLNTDFFLCQNSRVYR